jgi:hypothetical protein
MATSTKDVQLVFDTNGNLKIKQQDREIQRATEDILTDFDGTALKVL